MLFRTDDRNLSAKKKLEVKPYNLDEFSEPVINNFRRWPRGSASGAMTRKCDSLLPIELKPENVNTGFLAFFLTGRKKYFKIGSGPNWKWSSALHPQHAIAESQKKNAA